MPSWKNKPWKTQTYRLLTSVMFQLAMLAYLRNLKIECLESVCISPASNYGVIFGVLLGKTYSQICPFWEHLRLAMWLLNFRRMEGKAMRCRKASIAGTPRSPRRLAASILGEARWEGGCALGEKPTENRIPRHPGPPPEKIFGPVNTTWECL